MTGVVALAKRKTSKTTRSKAKRTTRKKKATARATSTRTSSTDDTSTEPPSETTPIDEDAPVTAESSTSASPDGLPLDQSKSETETEPIVGVHLWQIRWVRDLFWVALVLGVISAAYLIRAVVVPVLIGLGLAYIANPLIMWIQKKWKINRLASSLGLAITTFGLALIILVFFLPPVFEQAVNLRQNFDKYVDSAARFLNVNLVGEPDDDKSPEDDKTDSKTGPKGGQPDPDKAASTPSPTPATNPPPPQSTQGNPKQANAPNPDAKKDDADQNNALSTAQLGKLARSEWQSLGKIILNSLDIGIQAVGLLTYLAGAVFITAFCFVWFSWKFGGVIGWVDQFVPPQYRERTLHIVGRMDRSIAAFVRGRIIQCIIMGVILSVTWQWAAGIPYGLLLGLLAGFLNLVPFMAVLACGAAVVLGLTSQTAGDDFSWWPAVGAIIFYSLAQGVDGWVVEPYVQGKATDLDPLTVLLAVIFGGALAGLFGMILAIPIAACLKILTQELVFPKLKQWIAAWQ